MGRGKPANDDLIRGGALTHESNDDFLQTNGGELLYKTGEHLYISLIAVVLGIIVAVPLGVLLTRMKKAQARL